MKYNVLVFPCGSEIGLEVYKSLEFSAHFKVFGGSSVDDHGKYVYKNYIAHLPQVDDPAFIEKINEVVASRRIDFIIPAHDSVVLELAKASAGNNLDCQVITSPLKTCEIGRSKAKTYNYFKDTIPTPRVFQNVEEVDPGDFPVFLKPDVGQGSKGTYRADSADDINFYLHRDSSLLILEHLPGKEYTIDCFTSKTGKLLFCEGRERKRISNGISVNTARTDNKRFKELASIINDRLSFRGAWFFQVKENSDKELVLMEIAPRIAGTMALVRCQGVNLPLLSLFDALSYPVEILENNYRITIDRALNNRYIHNIEYKHVYLDFDDLVIFNEQINTAIMAFVYQCINKGIKIHLLTKHKDNLNDTLSKYRLTGIFDELIWVKDADDKHAYIKHHDAIFIDDSFAERKSVRNALNIPVFDSHMIEGLMESF